MRLSSPAVKPQAFVSNIPCSPGPPIPFTGVTDTGFTVWESSHATIESLYIATREGTYPPWPAVKGGPRLQGIEVVARWAGLLTWKDATFQSDHQAETSDFATLAAPALLFHPQASETAAAI
jgi:hypothetical protein